jgi:hypothetical protein
VRIFRAEKRKINHPEENIKNKFQGQALGQMSWIVYSVVKNLVLRAGQE